MADSSNRRTVANRPKDFFAKQIRTSQLIASGGIANPESDDLSGVYSNLRLMIYPKDALEESGNSGITYKEGAFEGLVPPLLLNDPDGTGLNVGDDVWLFISGTQGGSSGKVLFGGDAVVSGTLYAKAALDLQSGFGPEHDPRLATQVVDINDNRYDDTTITDSVFWHAYNDLEPLEWAHPDAAGARDVLKIIGLKEDITNYTQDNAVPKFLTITDDGLVRFKTGNLSGGSGGTPGSTLIFSAGDGIHIEELGANEFSVGIHRLKESQTLLTPLVAGDPFNSSIIASMSTVTFTNLDVFVNGMLVSAGQSKDYIIQPATLSDPFTIAFNFTLEIDDTVTVIAYTEDGSSVTVVDPGDPENPGNPIIVVPGSGIAVAEITLGTITISVQRQKESGTPGQFLPVGTTYPTSIVDVDSTFENLDVFVNGMLVTSGENNDYTLDTIGDPKGIKFNFSLEPDDTILVIGY